MKLNPPETAPKHNHTAILAWFDDYRSLLVVWDGIEDQWIAAVPDSTLCGQSIFDYMEMEDKQFLGWLPMPQIDDEGNVTWPSASPA